MTPTSSAQASLCSAFVETLRALVVLAVAAAAATFGVINDKASETMHLSPPRFTRGEAGQSERERAPEAKLQQPASRERSKTVP